MARKVRVIHSVTKQALHDASLITYHLTPGDSIPYVGDTELRVDDRTDRDGFIEALCTQVKEVWGS